MYNRNKDREVSLNVEVNESKENNIKSSFKYGIDYLLKRMSIIRHQEIEVTKAIDDILVRQNEEKKETVKIELDVLKKSTNLMVKEQRRKLLKAMEEQMIEYADCLDFESAAIIRDEIQAIKNAYEK